MNRVRFRSFHISAGTYEFGINVVVSRDEKRVVGFVRWKFEDPNYSPELGVCRGRVFFRKGYCPILWIPQPPGSPREYATLCHEVLHVACIVMGWAGIPLTDESEEAYAHLIGYLITEILRRIR